MNELLASRRLLLSGERLVSAVKDLETGQRGYLLTGDPRYLEPYRAGSAAVGLQRAQLAAEEASGSRSSSVKQVLSLIDGKVQELDETIAVRQSSGPEAALQIVRTGRGQRLMGQIRVLMDDLNKREDQRLVEKTSVLEGDAFRIFLVTLFGSVGVLALLTQLRGNVNRAIASRDETLATLEEAREKLHVTLSGIGDGVITTDTQGRISFLNPAAERITEWKAQDATGKLVHEVFRIVNQDTRDPVENPVDIVLKTGANAGLANHTLLITRSGQEVPIDDSGAPILAKDGSTHGVILVFRDIGQRRLAERQIERWHMIFQGAGFGLALIDPEQKHIEDLNPAFALQHGYELDELRGQPFSTILVENTGDPTRVTDAGRSAGETLHRRKDGSVFPVLADVSTLADDTGKVMLYAGYFQDISERKKAELALRRSEARFNAAIEAVGDIIWTTNGLGEMEGEQRQWGEFTGQTLEEYQGMGWSQAVHPDDAQPTIDAWKQAVSERRVFVFEHRLRRKDGVYRSFSIRAVPVFDSSDDIREWVGLHSDITDERKNQQELQRSEMEFRGLAAAIPQLVWTSNAAGEFAFTNPTWDEYTGRPDGEVPWKQIVHPDEADTILEKWKEGTGGAKAFEFQTRLRRSADGSYRWFLCRSVPLMDQHGQVVRWLGSCTDIDDQMRRQDELKIANEALQRSNADLEQFAYAASHDLQEPLRMVSLYTQLLKEEYHDRLDEKAQIYIDFAVKGADRMARLLHDLLDYSRVSEAPDPNEVTDANEALQTVLQNLEGLLDRSAAHVESAPLPTLRVPSVHLILLLQNLIGNAVKYRGADPVVVGISAEHDGEFWRISVRDNAIGIDPQYLTQIFGVFKRLHGQAIEGTGIGLAICQRIVEKNGGRIWAESTPGKGSTFHFTLKGAPGDQTSGA